MNVLVTFVGCAAPDRHDLPVADPPAESTVAPAGAGGDGGARATYTVSFDHRATRRVGITLDAVCPGGSAAGAGLDLWMATWTPGSYLIRDHARYVDAVSASGPDGGRVSVARAAKNRWRVACAPGEPVRVAYEVVARTWSVRESYVDDAVAALEGAATWLVPDGVPGPFAVRLELPDGWTAATLLPTGPDPDGTYVAPDVDALIDGPVVAGALVEQALSVDGVPHAIVAVGDVGGWDPALAGADAERIVAVSRRLWGGTLPYARYRWLAMVGDAYGGGLEHLDGSRLAVDRGSTAAAGRADLDRLLAHELLHAWNGKRMRPAELAPLDYEREMPTPSLWLVEGVTSYYEAVLCARAGLLTEAQVLERLSLAIRAVETGAGKDRESLAAASRGAWTGLYRWDEDSPNRSVDYYDKGAVVGWLLDAAIRSSTGGRRSLDDAMRLMWTRHRDHPYTADDVRAALSEVAERDAGPWLAAWVDGTEPLDYGEALHTFGLAWKPAPTAPRAWLGVAPSDRGGRLVFGEVRVGTPAADAGIATDDELIGLGGIRVTAATLDARLAALGPGWSGQALIARRGALRTVDVTLAADGTGGHELQVDPGASPLAAQRRRGWLAP